MSDQGIRCVNARFLILRFLTPTPLFKMHQQQRYVRRIDALDARCLADRRRAKVS